MKQDKVENRTAVGLPFVATCSGGLFLLPLADDDEVEDCWVILDPL
jgi:hypothetical protein